MEFFKQAISSKAVIISFIGFTGYGSYLYLTYDTQSKLQHNIVNESIKILELNDEITKLIGYPLYIDKSISNSAVVEEDLAQFKVKIRGPRGIVHTEISGNSQTHDNIVKDNLFNEYFIHDNSLNNKLDNFLLENDSEIKDSNKFWRINYIISIYNDIIDIPVYPSKDIPINKSKIISRTKLSDIYNEILKRNKIYKNFDSLSEKEKEEIYKIKIRQKNIKESYLRYSMYSFLIVSFFFAFSLRKVFKKSTLKNSSLVDLSKELFFKNNLIKVKYKLSQNNTHFNPTVIGNKTNSAAKFYIDFFNEEVKGKLIAEYKYDKTSKEWVHTSVRSVIENEDIKIL